MFYFWIFFFILELNSQMQKLMDNLIKLKNDTNKLYSSYNTIKTNEFKKNSNQNPFEKFFVQK